MFNGWFDRRLELRSLFVTDQPYFNSPGYVCASEQGTKKDEKSGICSSVVA